MRRISTILLGAVIAHSELATEIPAAFLLQEQDTSWESYYANARPYLDEPLEKLVQLIPDLAGLQPASDQEQLPTILENTGEQVDEFFLNVVDLTAHEEITEEKLNVQGKVTTRLQVEDDYLIIRRGTEMLGNVREYRMDAKGNRMDQLGLAKGYLVTLGFALICDYFSTAFQSESQFRYLGDQRIGSRDTFVVAFAQQPGKATLYSTLTGRKGTRIHMLMQGIAWVDKSNFELVRIRTDLLAPYPEVGLDQQTTDVTLSKVQLPDMASPLWLPQNVKVYLRLKRFDSDPEQFHELSFRNEHRYTNYRHYRVSTKMIVPQ